MDTVCSAHWTHKIINGCKAAYKAVHILAAEAKGAGNVTSAGLVRALRGLKYKGVTGNFDHTGRYRGGPGQTAYMPIAFTRDKYITPAKS
jgi:ABC-type branched-subunit amino acid transport system substrate-binding protein